MTSVADRPSARSETAETAETARLFEEYSEQILAFCVRRLGSRSEAEDAVQLTFLHALRALRRGVVPESESAWLFAIAKNVCLTQQRTLSRRGTLSSDRDPDSFAARERPDGDDAGLCRDLKEALRAIPANQRRALVLREWHGLPSNEVAVRLEMSTAATYALLTRARQSFTKAFTARREALPGLQLGALVYQFRAQLKALFGAASTKAAVATVVVVGGVGGGVALERSTDGTPAGPPAAPAPVIDVGAADTSASGGATSSSILGRASKTTATGERSGPGPAGTGGAQLGEEQQVMRIPIVAPHVPADVPAPTPPGGADLPGTPKTEPLPSVPVDPPPLPGVELPVDLLPPPELPPLPPVELPPLPPVPLPPTEDLPQLPPPPDLPLPKLPG